MQLKSSSKKHFKISKGAACANDSVAYSYALLNPCLVSSLAGRLTLFNKGFAVFTVSPF